MLFVMVQRRISEIGTQMAIGARRAVVTAQIVGESLMLAALGGYLGIRLSWLLVERRCVMSDPRSGVAPNGGLSIMSERRSRRGGNPLVPTESAQRETSQAPDRQP
jgi:hypothetical protein